MSAAAKELFHRRSRRHCLSVVRSSRIGAGLKKFKACIASCPFVETTAEVSGAYDMIVQGSCASLAQYNEHMDAIRPFIAEFVTRIETSFIGKVIESSNDDEESETLWLPCEDGHKQVPTHMVDKVEAEGDYMRVHVGDWNCLVHETFYRLSERLGPTDFIKLHRSALVRIGFIDRIIHRDHRWTALLRDGSRINVAKSQVHHGFKW